MCTPPREAGEPGPGTLPSRAARAVCRQGQGPPRARFGYRSTGACRIAGDHAATTLRWLAATASSSSLREAIADRRNGSGGDDRTGWGDRHRKVPVARGGASTLGARHDDTCTPTGEVVTRETPYFAWRDLLRQLLGAEWDDPEQRVLERLRDNISRSDPDLLPWLPLIAIAVGLQVPSTTEVNQLAPEARATRLREVATVSCAARWWCRRSSRSSTHT